MPRLRREHELAFGGADIPAQCLGGPPAGRPRNSGHRRSYRLSCRGRLAAIACGMAPSILPTAADVDKAARVIAPAAVRTRLISSPVLDATVGARVFLKP